MPISVKEVMKTAAELIGADGLAKSVEEGGSSSEELSLLLKCFNLVENEVALDYFPLKKQERFTPSAGKISYTKFAEAPVRILKLTGSSGNSLAFELFFDRIDCKGYSREVEITYAFAPRVKALTDNSDFAGKISVRLLAFGVAAEYLLATNRYAEAAAFEKKYREALLAAANERRKLSIRARRWA